MNGCVNVTYMTMLMNEAKGDVSAVNTVRRAGADRHLGIHMMVFSLSESSPIACSSSSSSCFSLAGVGNGGSRVGRKWGEGYRIK